VNDNSLSGVPASGYSTRSVRKNDEIAVCVRAMNRSILIGACR
jgi:hypothetical protein